MIRSQHSSPQMPVRTSFWRISGLAWHNDLGKSDAQAVRVAHGGTLRDILGVPFLFCGMEENAIRARNSGTLSEALHSRYPETTRVALSQSPNIFRTLRLSGQESSLH